MSENQIRPNQIYWYIWIFKSSETSERHNPNDVYKNYITAHIEAAITVSITDRKWRDRKEKHHKSKTKSSWPRRNTSQVERTYQNLLRSRPEILDKPTKKLLTVNWKSNLNSLRRENLTQYWKKLNEEKLQARTKYLLKYERQGYLIVYIFNYIKVEKIYLPLATCCFEQILE